MFRCHIIGHPLNKPRSVKIWKKYFKLNKIKSTMTPYEVRANKLSSFFQEINNNKNFLASAVTSPHKIASFNYIVPGDKISKTSGSVNLIIKKNFKLYGFNTDIIALIKIIKKYKAKNILIIGLGGVGMPLSKVLLELNYKVYAFTKKNIKSKKLKKIKNLQNFNFDNINLIINCTPLGSDLKKYFLKKTPLSESSLKKIDKNKTKILDIIYKPKKTILFNLCKKYKIKYDDGIQMNNLQAKIALKLISEHLKKDV